TDDCVVTLLKHLFQRSIVTRLDDKNCDLEKLHKKWQQVNKKLIVWIIQ
ncbi:MAG: hypothetical protein Harvfovirus57_11, partial [Harvfovirus sp.]